MKRLNFPVSRPGTALGLCILMVSALLPAMAQTSPRSAVQKAQSVGGQPQGPGGPTRNITRTHQPAGTPHKVSSFAPHPTKQRVYGAPIQSPILTKTEPKKTPPK